MDQRQLAILVVVRLTMGVGAIVLFSVGMGTRGQAGAVLVGVSFLLAFLWACLHVGTWILLRKNRRDRP